MLIKRWETHFTKKYWMFQETEDGLLHLLAVKMPINTRKFYSSEADIYGHPTSLVNIRGSEAKKN